jgi:hypothetical protein
VQDSPSALELSFSQRQRDESACLDLIFRRPRREDADADTQRRASITAAAFVTSTVRAGQLFVPMHYRAVNRLTHSAFDPHSRQPSYKYCAVTIRAA